MQSLAIGFAMLGLTATIVPAQSPPTQWARPGDTLRVWAETPTLRRAQAVVRRSTADTIFFSVQSAASRSWLETPVAADRITRIEIRDEPQTAKSRAFVGVVSGAVIGGAAGAGMVYGTYQLLCPFPSNDCDLGNGRQIDRRVFMTFGGAAVGLAGGIIGGIIGSRPVVGWRSIFVRP